MSRLNIARKIIDNLTPGIAQVGNVWLPLPTILMLPLIWNNFLWHSGIAGAIMSMSAYVIGGFYIIKTIKLLTNSLAAGIFGLSIYALNINLLFIQTSAMSEALFLCSLAATLYYLLLWTHTNKFTDLIKTAIAVNAATLTRYEGLAILLSYVVIIGIYSYLTTKKWSRAEANLISFSALAFLGFGFWTLYLWAIFGDPLYWQHFYLYTPSTTPNYVPTYAQEVQQLNIFTATWKYLVTSIWMTGLIPTIYAFIGIIIATKTYLHKRDLKKIPLLVTFAIFLFMVLTLSKNTPIKQPELTVASILSPTTSIFNEYNIRYGLLMLPFFAVFSALLFKYKNVFFRCFLILIFSIQLVSYFIPKYSVIFQLPITFAPTIKNSYSADVEWLKAHYDGGLIMVSALKHDPQMFQTGYNFKTFIHEGTGKYWKTSIKNPTKYATWVWFSYSNPDDRVTKYLKDSKVLKEKYNLVYNHKDVRIYKIK